VQTLRPFVDTAMFGYTDPLLDNKLGEPLSIDRVQGGSA